jgi:hypothetical protein
MVAGACASFGAILDSMLDRCYGSAKEGLAPLLSGLLKAESLGWKSLLNDLEASYSDKICKVWNDHENSDTIWAIHTLFEEKKKQIIDHAIANRYKMDPNLWLYYGLVVGNTNIKKLEGLFGAIGIDHTVRELNDLVSKTRTSKQSVQEDRRDCPKEWFRVLQSNESIEIKRAVVDDLLGSKRAGERHVGQILERNPEHFVSLSRNASKRRILES